MSIKIFVDDIRKTPAGFIRTYTVNETIELLKKCCRDRIEIELLSLDHDAGDFCKDGGDYIKILDWIEEQVFLGCEYYSRIKFYLHTGNPYGKTKMWQIITKNGWELIEYPED